MFGRIYKLNFNLNRPVKCRSVLVLGAFLVACAFASLKSQSQILPVKFDDFNQIHGWWHYHRDGTAAQDEQAIENGQGYLRISLKNPVQNLECNVGISEFQNVYGKSVKKLVAEARIKLLNPMRPGSRGWGLWKSRKKAKIHSLAWFMEQLAPNAPQFCWQLAGTVVKKRRQTVEWQPDLDQWHVYRIERDLVNNITFFWVDDRLILKTPGLAPADRLSFHLWIDNQVYSKKGVLRTSWAGESAMVVDYVKITTSAQAKTEIFQSKNAAILAYRKWDDVFCEQGKFTIAQIPFNLKGQKVYAVITACLENYDGYDEPDALFFYLDNNTKEEIVLKENDTQNLSKTSLFPLELAPGQHHLTVKGRTSPVLNDILLIDGDESEILLDKQNILLADKTVEYNIDLKQKGKFLFYLATTLKEAPQFNQITPISVLEDADDDLQFALSDQSGSQIKTFEFCGNRSFGQGRTKLFEFETNTRRLQLKLKSKGKPILHRLILFRLK